MVGHGSTRTSRGSEGMARGRTRVGARGRDGDEYHETNRDRGGSMSAVGRIHNGMAAYGRV